MNNEANNWGICECEQDWNCGLHGGTNRPTWIESRFEDDEEDRCWGITR